MIAPAAVPVSRARGSRTNFAIAVLILAGWAAPARAEIGATVSIFSDLRFRGYSLSEGRPVGVFDFAYDDPSGFYAAAAAMGVVRHDGDPEPLGFQLNAGYAKRLRSGTTLDFGATHSAYPHYSRSDGSASYTEVYAGVSRGAFASRLFLSPHYSSQGLWTAYGEVNGTFSPARKWAVDGHVGMLVPLRTPSNEHYRPAFDGRIGVSRELGRLSLHAAVGKGVHGRDYYGVHRYGGSAFVAGASLTL